MNSENWIRPLSKKIPAYLRFGVGKFWGANLSKGSGSCTLSAGTARCIEELERAS